jgi:predicted nucleic acid-binding protein
MRQQCRSEHGRPAPPCAGYFTSGRLGAGSRDIYDARQDFADVEALGLNEPIALEAARLQDDILDDGERLATADILIAATARSTGDELEAAAEIVSEAVAGDA